MKIITHGKATVIAQRWDGMAKDDDTALAMAILSGTGGVQSESHRGKLLSHIDHELQDVIARMGFMPNYDPETELDLLRAYVAQVKLSA